MPVAMSQLDAEAEIEALSLADGFLAYSQMSQAQRNACLRLAKRNDASGHEPTHTLWTPSWDIAAGVMRVWQLRAAATACAYDYKEGDAQHAFEQMHKHCLEQAAYWQTQMEAYSVPYVTYEDVAPGP